MAPACSPEACSSISHTNSRQRQHILPRSVCALCLLVGTHRFMSSTRFCRSFSSSSSSRFSSRCSWLSTCQTTRMTAAWQLCCHACKCCSKHLRKAIPAPARCPSAPDPPLLWPPPAPAALWQPAHDAACFLWRLCCCRGAYDLEWRGKRRGGGAARRRAGGQAARKIGRQFQYPPSTTPLPLRRSAASPAHLLQKI